MNIAERIDVIIKKRGISRRKLALTAGISPSTLQSAMERGKGMPIEMVEKIAATLNMSLGELLEYSPDSVGKAAADTALQGAVDKVKKFDAAIWDLNMVHSDADEELFFRDVSELHGYFDKLNYNNRQVIIGLARMLSAIESNCKTDKQSAEHTDRIN